MGNSKGLQEVKGTLGALDKVADLRNAAMSGNPIGIAGSAPFVSVAAFGLSLVDGRLNKETITAAFLNGFEAFVAANPFGAVLIAGKRLVEMFAKHGDWPGNWGSLAAAGLSGEECWLLLVECELRGLPRDKAFAAFEKYMREAAAVGKRGVDNPWNRPMWKTLAINQAGKRLERFCKYCIDTQKYGSPMFLDLGAFEDREAKAVRRLAGEKVAGFPPVSLAEARRIRDAREAYEFVEIFGLKSPKYLSEEQQLGLEKRLAFAYSAVDVKEEIRSLKEFKRRERIADVLSRVEAGKTDTVIGTLGDFVSEDDVVIVNVESESVLQGNEDFDVTSDMGMKEFIQGRESVVVKSEKEYLKEETSFLERLIWDAVHLPGRIWHYVSQLWS